MIGDKGGCAMHDRAMLSVLKKHSYVGVVDTNNALMQHSTKLMLVRHVELR
jgi:hypothetical protein